MVWFKPGDTVFYHNKILHRALYPTMPLRQMLHVCMRWTKLGVERARNILQQDMGWIGELKTEGRLKHMRKNLVNLKDEVGGDIGFSLSGQVHYGSSLSV